MNVAIHIYPFHSLKVIDLRTGIDFERLITNHISSCMVHVIGKQDLKKDMISCACVFLFCSAEVEPSVWHTRKVFLM